MIEKLRTLLNKPGASEDDVFSAVQSAVNRAGQVDQLTARAEKAENRVKEFEQKGLEAEADAFLEKHKDVILNKDAVREQYIRNKEATVALFGGIKKPEADDGQKALNRGDAKPPEGGPGGGADDKADKRARAIRNRAQELQTQNRSRSWQDCFNQARSEVEARD